MFLSTLIRSGHLDISETPSANAFVKEALKLKLRNVRKARLYSAYDEAADDPEFLANMGATTRVFDTTVGDELADGPQ